MTETALAELLSRDLSGLDLGFRNARNRGSFGMADPDTGIGFGYVMNRLGFHLWSDPRELALRQVLFHDILGARSQT
jgi:hypothetical protein